MWRLYQTSKALSQRPSHLLTVDDPWLALQVDNAVVYFGIVVENALQERIQVGGRWEAKYQLPQLLDPSFRLPAPTPSKAHTQDGNIVSTLRVWAGLFKGRGIKVFKR